MPGGRQLAGGGKRRRQVLRPGRGNGVSSILSRNDFSGAISKATYFLENGADPDYVCNDGRTLLLTASRYGSTETVKLLLNDGADPNKLNGKPRFGHYKPANSEAAFWVVAGTTGLLESSTNKVARLLIEHKVDVNYRDPNGTTPLDRAIATQKNALVALLKAAGAKTSRKQK